MAWWSRTDGLPSEPKKSVPRGVWTKCEGCAATLQELELDEHARVCKHCGHHHRMGTEARIALIVDEGSWQEVDTNLVSDDPLEFRVDDQRYRDQLRAAAKKTSGSDAYRAGSATIGGYASELGFFDFAFMGGSMGSVVGEKIARQFERAMERRRPAVVFCASGGARMQEGVLSLMQMAKTSAARSRLREARVPYIAVLLHPTTGGVAASIAMLGDIIIAEPNALIGFAGPRVIEQTIRQQLPPGFQRSEFLLEHGMVDMIVERPRLKDTLMRIMAWFGGANGAPGGANGAPSGSAGASSGVSGASNGSAGAYSGVSDLVSDDFDADEG